MATTHAHTAANPADPNDELYHEHHSQHITPVRVYLVIFVWLMVLLIATVAAAYVNLGPWGVVLAYAIAAVKGILIIMYFMHVKYSSRLTQIFAVSSFMWLALLFVFTMGDYMFRGVVPRADARTHLTDPQTGRTTVDSAAPAGAGGHEEPSAH